MNHFHCASAFAWWNQRVLITIILFTKAYSTYHCAILWPWTLFLYSFGLFLFDAWIFTLSLISNIHVIISLPLVISNISSHSSSQLSWWISLFFNFLFFFTIVFIIHLIFLTFCPIWITNLIVYSTSYYSSITWSILIVWNSVLWRVMLFCLTLW